MKRIPFREGEVEVRQVFERTSRRATPRGELRQAEERLRDQLAQQGA